MNERYKSDYLEVINVIKGITDKDLIEKYKQLKPKDPKMKSLARAINNLLKERLTVFNWESESPIFKDEQYTEQKSYWRLDFAKKLKNNESKSSFSIEVAFNHQEATAHNIIKPVLGSELNHVEKNIQTEIGIIITATKDLKYTGGFDNAIGTYEGFISFLKPYNNILTVPMIIIGLSSPSEFHLNEKKIINGPAGGCKWKSCLVCDKLKKEKINTVKKKYKEEIDDLKTEKQILESKRKEANTQKNKILAQIFKEKKLNIHLKISEKEIKKEEEIKGIKNL